MFFRFEGLGTVGTAGQARIYDNLSTDSHMLVGKQWASVTVLFRLDGTWQPSHSFIDKLK